MQLMGCVLILRAPTGREDPAPAVSEGGVKVADGAHLLEERGDLKYCRFRQPGGDDLYADRKTVVACSEPHRQGRQAGQAEGRSRALHVEWRNRLAIDHKVFETMLSRRERRHWAEQRIVSLEIIGEVVAQMLHRLPGGNKVGHRRVRGVKDKLGMPENLGLVSGGHLLELGPAFHLLKLPEDGARIGLL
jgi:hypothetical protein